MDINSLPPELLLEIFQYMRGRDIIECGNVCQRWKLVVDGLTDEFWREMCKRDHSVVYKNAHRKARLSWRQLCRSLDLWSEIATADVRVQKIPDIGVTSRFRILGNGILACTEEINPSDSRFIVDDDLPECNAVAYYDLVTLQRIHRETSDFIFIFYDENDHLLVVQDYESTMCVIPKANKESYIHVYLARHDFKQWALNGNKVYYLTKPNKLCCIKMIEDNNGVAWENVIVLDDAQQIKSLNSVVDINNTQINIRAYDDRNQDSIYSLIEGELKKKFTFDGRLDKIELIHRHGFQVPIYLLSLLDDGFPFQLLYVYFYGKIAIAMIYINQNDDKIVCEHFLRIHYNAFGEDGRLFPRILLNSEPVKSIKLPKDFVNTHVNIDVIETRSGHKIVISYIGKLLVFEFEHEVGETD